MLRTIKENLFDIIWISTMMTAMAIVGVYNVLEYGNVDYATLVGGIIAIIFSVVVLGLYFTELWFEVRRES